MIRESDYVGDTMYQDMGAMIVLAKKTHDKNWEKIVLIRYLDEKAYG